MKILIVNGPNLNMLGRREPAIYGTESMQDVLLRLHHTFPEVDLEYFQSNHEGELIDRLQAAGFGTEGVNGIVLNAGGLTHTSVSLADAVASLPVPVVEVHISNPAAREDFRKKSYLSPVCLGTIAGFGTMVYELGIRALLKI